MKPVARHLLGRTPFFPKFLIISVLFLLSVYFILPIRNIVLNPIWPKGWRDLATSHALKMWRGRFVHNVTEWGHCPSKIKSQVSSKQAQRMLRPTAPIPKSQLKDPSHWKFLPWIDDKKKGKLLWLYMVMAEELDKAGVEHFLVDGSLLGAARVRGIIPWDDDIDIIINGSQWMDVRRALSCIDGFHLIANTKMHWKFSFQEPHPYFPYVDVFFYMNDDRYMWAMTDYIVPTLVYPLEDVFPVKKTTFELLPRVPMPRNTEKVADRVFDLLTCVSPSVNHETGESFSVAAFPCSRLDYIYQQTIVSL